MADVSGVSLEEQDDPAAAALDPPTLQPNAVRGDRREVLRAQAVVGGQGVEPAEREVEEAVFEPAHALGCRGRKTRMKIVRAIAFAAAALSVVVAAEGSSSAKSKSLEVTYYYLPG